MGIVGRLDQYASMLAGEFDDYSMSENLFLYSEQYNQSSWINQGSFETTDTTGTLSPDGFNTAEKLIGNNGQANRQSIYQTVSVTSGTTYTFSVFLKQAERRYATIWFDALSITEGAYYGASTYIDLQTGTIATGTQSRIVAYPNGWYRVYVTATPSFTGSLNLNLAIGTPNNAADGAGSIAYQYTGDGVSGFYIWGGQFERGTGPTDYTPTTTTAISRVLPSTTNTNITGLSTYFSSGFSENVGAATTLVANVFPPYDPIYDDFGGTLFGAGQGRYMRQNTDKSVIVYNEIDEVTDFYSRGVVRAGLVLDLDAGVPSSYPGTGTTWTDLSPYGNNGTLTLGPTYSSANGGSIVFDGTDDNIQLGNTSNIISASQSQITVNTWVKTNVVGVYKKILVNVTVGTQSITGIYFSIGPSPFNTYFGLTTSGGQSAATYTQDISTSVYSNLCGTYDGSNLRLYLNGNLVATQPHTGTIGNTGITRISGYDNNTETWNGNIASAQIYNRALTATEVLQNYNALKHRFGL